MQLKSTGQEVFPLPSMSDKPACKKGYTRIQRPFLPHENGGNIGSEICIVADNNLV